MCRLLPTLRGLAVPTLNLTGVHKMDIFDDNFWAIVEERLKAEYEDAKSNEEDKRNNRRQQQAAVTAAVIATVL